jgi:hypothetical protein
MHSEKLNNRMRQIINSRTFLLTLGYCRKTYQEDNIPNQIVLFICSLFFDQLTKVGCISTRSKPSNDFYFNIYTLFFTSKKILLTVKKAIIDFETTHPTCLHEKEDNSPLYNGLFCFTYYELAYTLNQNTPTFYNMLKKKYNVIGLLVSNQSNKADEIQKADDRYYSTVGIDHQNKTEDKTSLEKHTKEVTQNLFLKK